MNLLLHVQAANTVSNPNVADVFDLGMLARFSTDCQHPKYNNFAKGRLTVGTHTFNSLGFFNASFKRSSVAHFVLMKAGYDFGRSLIKVEIY